MTWLTQLLADVIGGDLRSIRHSKYMAQTQRRAWRTRERAARVKPVSDKVAYYNPKADAVAAVKPRGRGK